METIKFTPTGYQHLQHEFDRLTKLRIEVVNRLQTAREMGDLSENGAYKAAKWELGGIDRELRRLTYLLRVGRVTSPKSSALIDFGSTITISQNEKTFTFTLVSKYEANPSQGKLSVDSPYGKAVLGKQVGDQIIIDTPNGTQSWLIVRIS